MSDYKFNCPKCQQPIAAPAEMLGQVVDCPACNIRIQLPSLNDQSTPSTTTLPPVAWHYMLNGKRIGPTSETEIKRLLSVGTLDNKTLVWKENLDDWIPISQTALKCPTTTPPPLTGAAVSNGYVWTVAFVPIWGTVLEYIVAGATDSNVENLWFITLLLNITFCIVDGRVLKNAGHDTDKFGGWAWFVPVYLYKRAKALNQSLSYFITWMALFVASLFLQ